MKNKELFNEKMKLIGSLILRIIIYYIVAVIFYIVVLDNLLGNFLGNTLYRFNYNLYEWCVYNKEPIFLFYMIIILVIALYRFFSKKVDNIEKLYKSFDNILNEETQNIELPNEMTRFSEKLNKIKYEYILSTKRAKEAEQKKNDLIMYMAHDLKTPLTSVIGYLSLLNEEQEISKKLQNKYIKIALDKALRVEELTNQFFEITRYNLNDIPLNKTNIDLVMLLDQLVEEFYPMLEERNLKLNITKPNILMYNADGDKLARAFGNLLKNAISYSYENTTITINMIENEDEYNAAVAKVEEGLTFEKGYAGTSNYSYHTAATIKQVVQQVMDEKNISKDLAETYVYGSGLTIYSTEDSSIQARVEEEFAKQKYQISGRLKNEDGTLKNDHTQAGMVIIDNQTNQVVAVGGSLGEQNSIGLNRGTQITRQTGSSMKPLADIAPGLQEKIITAATIYDDAKTDFGGGYKPDDYNTPKGLINIRSCIRTSQNIPMVKVMAQLTPKKSIEYLKKMGITTLDNTKDANLALSIGGLSIGISPLEMAGAYASIANDGVYTTPTFYTKVVDSSGNTVLTANQEKTRVISEQNAYITRSIIEEPVKSGGTATYCAIPGMETCAKTGSTDDYVDRWLCGMTPYYTAACWFGFDNNTVQEPLKYANGTVYSVDGRNPAGQLWSSIMKDIHKELEIVLFIILIISLIITFILDTIISHKIYISHTNKYGDILTIFNILSFGLLRPIFLFMVRNKSRY